MNHTPAINVWKGTNRVSRLWEDLSVICVSPDPIREDLQTWIVEADSSTGMLEQAEPAVPALLEQAGFESLRLVRQALEILSAPPKEEPVADTVREQSLDAQLDYRSEWDVRAISDRLQTGYAMETFIKVSMEPEQPASSIDTRRMAYGLKIPARPLHKRPVYQRVFFCLRGLVHKMSMSGG